MRSIAKHAPLLLAAGLLAACNSVTGITPVTRSTNGAAVVIGTNGATTSVDGVPLTDTAFIVPIATPIFAAYTTNVSDRYLFLGRSFSGDVSTALVATNGAVTPMALAAYGRTGTGDLPTAGSAAMAGYYLGLIGTTTGTEMENHVDDYITGQVALTANFASNAVSGTIYNRMLGGSTAMNNVALTAAPIAGDGSYAGTATGGGDPSATEFNGTYAGLLNGDGTESAGALMMLYNSGGTNFAELGSYIAQ